MGQTYNLAQRFRDLMTLAVGMDSVKMNSFMSDLNDSERSEIENAMGICFSNMFALQPAPSFWRRRLIPEVPEGAEEMMYATENVILSKLVENIADDPLSIYQPLKNRLFVQWFLDEITMAYYKWHGKAPTIG